MTSIGNRAVRKIVDLLTAPAGLSASTGILAAAEGIMLPLIADRQIIAENISVELAEKSGYAKHNAVLVYSDKIANTLKEKFRTFSGHVSVSIEVRVTHDRMEGLDQALRVYVDSIGEVLNQNRGDWGGGLFYAGAYEAVFGAVKHGGRNFIKIAKISIDVDASVN